MKLKSKLIMSFCMVIIIPMVLIYVTVNGFLNYQLHQMEENYDISDIELYDITNVIQLLNRFTQAEFEELIEMAYHTPSQLLVEEYLEELNESLKDKRSYLVVRKNNQMTFNGGVNNEEMVSTLPRYSNVYQTIFSGTYIDSADDMIVKHVNFVFPDQTNGTAFIITSTKHLVPEVKSLLIDLIVSVVAILILTAGLLIGWIYRSMITPIQKLQIGVENIKNGNLDFSLEIEGNDEISELCVTFEKMRKRLKDNAEEKLQNEADNRILLSNIAHDLKTPITAVKGYSEGILDGVANTPEKIDKYVKTIYNKANEMDTLINELTIYSKIDANRIPYNFIKLNVMKYFADCVSEIGIDLETKGIGLRYYNYTEDDVVIIADPEQLRRVINNIIGNSTKYMNKKEGLINIRVKDVGEFIQVEIEDNGIGIRSKDLPYIFDRFYRADASRNSSTGGSGIGLSIVKKIIEDHGGKIWATSKENTGTVMYFVLRKQQEVKYE